MITQLYNEVEDVLHNNILSFWLNNMQDTEHGGFYGQMKGDGTLVKDANKGAILNARILWSFSAAYRVTGRKKYLTAADRALHFIIRYFLDKENGGVYWEVDHCGKPINTKKQFYALGFALYGFTEYVRATKDITVLSYAIDLFNVIEQHALDKEFNGYIEAMECDWKPIADMRLSELDANYPKSQNTHLHIIEPYTNLLRTCREIGYEADFTRTVENSVRNLIHIFIDRILNPETHHLDLFFNMDWSRGGGNLESYGHDIECSWLLHEAAIVLGDKELLAKVEPVVLMVAEASRKGLNTDGSMTHEANLDTGHVDSDRHWWVQAENVVGWFNIYQHFGDKNALENTKKGWDYIKSHLIDYDNGEWFWSCDTEGMLNTHDDHAGFWKCPYHNTRMCLEIMERICG